MNDVHVINGLQCRNEKLEDIYDIKEELGRGQFAVVKKCISKQGQESVAAKFIKVKRTRSSRNGLSRDLIEREASILMSVDHEKIIKLHDVFDLGVELVLVLELLSGGELFDKICELEYMTEVDACCYLKQVLLGVEHLHTANIVHLDIKPENIVLKSKDGTDIKLVDFGLAQRLKPDEDLKEMMGTPEFVAPEVINYEKIGLYTDMWAIGVLAYILLSGCSPFLGDDNQETYENIIKVDYHFDEEYFDKISIDAKEFVSELLIKNPNKRNTVHDSLSHPWILTMSAPRSRQDSTIIATNRFKAFVARRRWQQSFQKLNAITRFSKFLKKGVLPTFNEELTQPIDTTNTLAHKSTSPSQILHVNIPNSTISEQEHEHKHKPSITPDDVKPIKQALLALLAKQKQKRKIKQYLTFDDEDEDEYDEDEVDDHDDDYSLISEKSSIDEDNCFIENFSCSSTSLNSLHKIRRESECLGELDKQTLHGTLELWKKDNLGKHRAKIKKIQRSKRISILSLSNDISTRNLSAVDEYENTNLSKIEAVKEKDMNITQDNSITFYHSSKKKQNGIINVETPPHHVFSFPNIVIISNHTAAWVEAHHSKDISDNSADIGTEKINDQPNSTTELIVIDNIPSHHNDTIKNENNTEMVLNDFNNVHFKAEYNTLSNTNITDNNCDDNDIGLTLHTSDVNQNYIKNIENLENENISSQQNLKPFKHDLDNDDYKIENISMKTSTPMHLTSIKLLPTSSNSDVQKKLSTSSSSSKGYEILEILDKCEDYRIQTVEERDGVETEYIDRVYVTSLCETIDLHERLVDKKSIKNNNNHSKGIASKFFKTFSSSSPKIPKQRKEIEQFNFETLDLKSDISFNRSFPHTSANMNEMISNLYGDYVVIDMDVKGNVKWNDKNSSGVYITVNT